jgi:hypothetical protein
MKTIFASALVVTMLVSAALSQSFHEQLMAQLNDSSALPKNETPFACDRLALTTAQRKRHFDELGPTLRARKKSVRELANGYEFEFSPDPATLQLVAEWAAGEHVCCPFFDIDLRLQKEGGPLWLRLTGRDGVKQFLEVEGSAWTKR